MRLIKTQLQNGMNFWYRSDDKYIGRRIALQKYEEYESMLILRNVNKNSVVVDVGANIGYYTLLLAKICKKVYAFEPDKMCYEILLKNIAENNLKNVVAINKALGDKKEKVGIVNSKDNFGDNKINPSKSPFDKGDFVECVRLDDVINGKIDLIKIDVQGWESKVVSGTKKIIKKHSPVLFLEFNGDYKMISLLKKYYKNIWSIDYWFYVCKKGIWIDKKTGYVDLFVKKQLKITDWINLFRFIRIRKVIRKILKQKWY